jgi:UDP-2,4-diacetamido-2,4,6-trideoxy-beta-L-altropyranose hydrolase
LRGTIYFRADGSSEIGLGHIVRCISLARMLDRNFNIIFVSINPHLSIETGLKDLGYSIIKIENEESFFNILSNTDIVVIDKYDFDKVYHHKIRKIGARIVCIDDLHDKEYEADLIINHGPSVKSSNYRSNSTTKFALGHEFLMLRPEFFEVMKKEVVFKKSNHLLIFLGGSDIKGLGIEILKLNIDKVFKHIHIISGASNPHFSKLKEIAESKKNICIYENLSSSQLIELAKKCEMCICTPSGVSYEMACIGISLVLCLVTPNQKHFYDFFILNKLAIGQSFLDNSDIIALFEKIKILKANENTQRLQIEKQKVFFNKNPRDSFINLFSQL